MSRFSLFFTQQRTQPRVKKPQFGAQAQNLILCALRVNRKMRQHGVIRLSLGKLLVNLLQVVKRTNTPLLID